MGRSKCIRDNDLLYAQAEQFPEHHQAIKAWERSPLKPAINCLLACVAEIYSDTMILQDVSAIVCTHASIDARQRKWARGFTQNSIMFILILLKLGTTVVFYTIFRKRQI